MATPAFEIVIDVLNDEEVEISFEIPDELYDRLMTIPAPRPALGIKRPAPALAVVTPFPRQQQQKRLPRSSSPLLALLPIALLGVGLWLTWSACTRRT